MLLRCVGCVISVGRVLDASRVVYPQHIEEGLLSKNKDVIEVWDRRKNKKNPTKTESILLFRFFFSTEKSTNKGRYSVGKTDEKLTEISYEY